MGILRDSFIEWSDASGLPDEIWNQEFDPTNDDVFGTLLTLVAREQGKSLYEVTTSICRDITRLLANPPSGCNPVNLEFLLFCASIAPMGVAIRKGNLSLAHDWFSNGFGDDVSADVERVFQVERIDRFFASQVNWIRLNLLTQLQQWFPEFYYYCRIRAAFPDAARMMAPHALDAAVRSSQEGIEILRNLLDWAYLNEKTVAKHAAELLLTHYESGNLPEQVLRSIGVSFLSGAAEFTPRTSRGWAESLLEGETRKHLEPAELLSALSTVTETKEEWDNNKKSILESLDCHFASLGTEGQPLTVRLELLDTGSFLLHPLVVLLHQLGERDDLLLVLCRWHGLSEDLRFTDPVLFILPNQPQGMGYLGSENQLFSRAENAPTIEQLTRIANETHGTAITVRGSDQEVDRPERQGQPDYDRAGDYEEALENYFLFNLVSRENIERATAEITFPGANEPTQALMKKNVGKCLPSLVSLKAPLPERQVETVGLWAAGNDYYSDMETRAVEQVLKAAGISSESFSGHGASKEYFQKFYENERWDVIWFSGHGLYDHWDPHSAVLVIGDRCRIDLNELASMATPDGGQRCLMLNVCDGAAATVGGFQKSGVAHMLAGPTQVGISHLWPVDPLVASAFGVLFARELVAHQGYFAAFEGALDALRRDWQAIASDIEDFVPGKLADRLRNSEREMNILRWASPCFLL